MRRSGSPTSRAGVRLLVGALGLVLALTGCTGELFRPGPGPSEAGDSPERAAAALAEGLSRLDLTDVEFVGTDGRTVDERFTRLVRGMGAARPSVTVAGVEPAGEATEARLDVSWRFPGVPRAWTYGSAAELVREDGRWKTRWAPTVVHPDLDGRRLVARRLAPQRGRLLGEDGERIVTARPVVRIGIDKTKVRPEALRRSATRLARLVDIDVDGYVDRVTGAGPEAFVEAIVLRAQARERPSNREVYAIEGGVPIQTEQMLAPTRDFARPILGGVGPATEELVEAGRGAVVAGDQVGLSGLQRRYDAQLRGTPGVLVELADDPAGPGAASPSPGRASARPSVPARPAVTAFEVTPVAGRPLSTTLNLDLQTRAESVLARQKPASALVAVRPSTGAVVAAASGPGGNGQSTATVGQFAPGSTFKVVSALALLRAGLRPDSPVSCPATLEVDGRRFENYDDYPASAEGRIDLATAFAQSCNTAFMGERDRLEPTDLQQAAASLGVSTDYDVGFPAYFGSVPRQSTETGRAAALIGQSDVQASPLAMAAAAASVGAGRTVVPQLVAGVRARPRAQPLTEEETTELQSLMRRVVTEGSGRQLAQLPGPDVLAKTGTAEYGTDDPPRTHAWMIAVRGDLAVAVFVADGESGSRTAGPLLERFLRAAA